MPYLEYCFRVVIVGILAAATGSWVGHLLFGNQPGHEGREVIMGLLFAGIFGLWYAYLYAQEYCDDEQFV
jgi:hypothetical protein